MSKRYTQELNRSKQRAGMAQAKVGHKIDLTKLHEITDEQVLHRMIHDTNDNDLRIEIRARLREIREKKNADTDKKNKVREEALENLLKEKKRLAEEEKVKKLQECLERVKADDKQASVGKVDLETVKPSTSSDLSTKDSQISSTKLFKGAASTSGSKVTKNPMPITSQTKDDKPIVGSKQTKQISRVGIMSGSGYKLTKTQTSGSASNRPMLQRSASTIKQMLLEWCKIMTKDYNVEIRNFSTSWNDGIAFCALIHNFRPYAFDFSKLKPENRRANFTLAFEVAEKEADIAPLLEVDDMVKMMNPDWKCVFTYVQSFYRRFRNWEKDDEEKETKKKT